MSDLISRQAAIDAFDCTNELIVGGEANARNVENYINKVIGKIKDLPSAQPEQRWIPVSERPPEKNGEYLVTRQGRNIYAYLDLVEKGPCSGDIASDIVAWMPLPEPYKEGE